MATAFGLKNAYIAAERDTFATQVYPYIFIDQTQRAQLSNCRLYVDILGDFKIAYCSAGMKGYILAEKDFLAAYRILSDKKLFVIAALKNEDKKGKISNSLAEKNTDEDSEEITKRQGRREKSKKRKRNHKQRRELESDL